MLKKLINRIIYTMVMLFCSISLVAQESDGAYTGFSPYSVYGVGNLSRGGTSYNRAMGYTGIALRTKKFVNIMNPAAVTCRDSLSFMSDITLSQDNKIFQQGSFKTVNNTFNLQNLTISFPIYRSSAMYFGMAPYSDLGYDISGLGSNSKIIGITGDYAYTAKGNGGIYQAYFGGGVTLFRRLSLGVQGIYYFGNLRKQSTMQFSDPTYRSLLSGQKMSLHGTSVKLGVQYEYPLGNNYYLTMGATYKFGSDIKGYVDDYKYASLGSKVDTLHFQTDTLKYNKNKAKFANEFGVGISLKYNDKWSISLDYVQSNWSSCGLDKVVGFKNNSFNSGSIPSTGGNSVVSIFSATSSKSLRFGMEYVPNRNDIRYYLRRCSYKAGAYYNKDYFKVNGKSINSYGVTFGVTLPIFRFYNGLSLGVDLGRRGKQGYGMIRESYGNFTIGFNMYDIWFRKQRYQ